MKDILTRLLDRPTVLLLISGLLLLVLASAETVGIKGQTIAIVDPIWRIGLTIVGLSLVVTGVVLIVQDIRSPRPARPWKFKHDVFLASPMAALGDEAEFDRQRQDVLRIKQALQARAEIKTIYDAGDSLKAGKWDPEDVAAQADLDALRNSRYFVLVYTRKVASSVIFEAGCALAMGKQSIYIVRRASDLPFLMQELNNLPHHYPKVRIWQCQDADAIVERIEKSGRMLFNGRQDEAADG